MVRTVPQRKGAHRPLSTGVVSRFLRNSARSAEPLTGGAPPQYKAQSAPLKKGRALMPSGERSYLSEIRKKRNRLRNYNVCDPAPVLQYSVAAKITGITLTYLAHLKKSIRK